MLKGRHLISPNDFSLVEINEILSLGHEISISPAKFSNACDNKILATLFYEPSTRTRFSFEAAMLRLGGKVIGFSDAGSSSVSKGETISDTLQTVSCYADSIVMRHPKEGAPQKGIKNLNVPLINAGDGGNQHPTQTLTDLLTIKSLKGSIDNHVVAICGDLKYGRTVHSLVTTLNRYENIKFIFISPEELRIPEYIKDNLRKGSYEETDVLEDGLKNADIFYMTRIQMERFSDIKVYERLKGSYILNKEKMELAKDDMILMHPLPRVDEIDTDVDDDRRAVFFEQAKYGMYVRMALLMKVMGDDENVL